MKFFSYFIFLVLILVTSCSPTQEVIESTETSTQSPQPSITPTWTATFTPTLTPTSTITPSPTFTHTPSLTPTPTFTPTPTEIPILDYELLRIIDGDGMVSVHNIAFSPDSKLLVVGSKDASLRVWDVSNSQLIHRFSNDKGINWSVAFSPDGNVIASSYWNNPEIQLWSLSRGSLIRRIKTEGYFNRSLKFSPDGKMLANFTYQPGKMGLVEFWSIPDGDILQRIEVEEYIHYGAFSPDGKMIAASSITSNDIFVWRIEDGVLLHYINQYYPHPPDSPVSFSHKGNILAVTDNYKVNLWDLQAEKIISSYKMETYEKISEIFFSPDDRFLFGMAYIPGYFYRTQLYIWDLQENRLVRTIKRSEFDDISGCGPALAAMSPDGKYLAFAYLRVFIFGIQ